jgi:hypothetical protein
LQRHSSRAAKIVTRFIIVTIKIKNHGTAGQYVRSLFALDVEYEFEAAGKLPSKYASNRIIDGSA